MLGRLKVSPAIYLGVLEQARLTRGKKTANTNSFQKTPGWLYIFVIPMRRGRKGCVKTPII
jgi:hypothetical protein